MNDTPLINRILRALGMAAVVGLGVLAEQLFAIESSGIGAFILAILAGGIGFLVEFLRDRVNLEASTKPPHKKK